MKISVDYKVLSKAIRKFKEGKELNENEKDALEILIDASEGDYYPSEEEIEMQEIRARKLNEIDYHKNQELHQRLIDQCTVFENKFM